MRKEQKTKVNQDIRARRVILISEDGKRLGEFLTKDAISRAADAGLDLVEVGGGDVPTCKIMDYGRFLYNQKKKMKKSKSTTVNLKEIRFRPTTEQNDLNVLIKKARKFLSRGDKVRVVVRVKGREHRHMDIAEEKCMNFCSELEDVSESVPRPKKSGSQVFTILEPKND